ncbi:hypothetical protein RND81_05G182100 [Saponaria officinalis]|uniref:HTH myb-type domain-containing protein n=1 Tax=Saponaria officinalis TaxID=3572 RepID=A0AAW1KZW8_SAPOF
MREDSNWFLKWEEELPSPEELMPLSQTLISSDLASIFDIQKPNINFTNPNSFFQQPPAQHNSSELDSSSTELCGGVGGVVSGSDEPARTLKRPRLVWTPQLHKRFVDAVGHLGIKNAVPKTIMQLMSVDGLTRENVASHLQKYRLYLRRMHGAGNGPGHGGGLVGPGDSASDRLFASSPIPAHFLHPAAATGSGTRPNSDQSVPCMAVHGQQIAATGLGHQRIQSGHFGSGQGGREFDQVFLSRQAQIGSIRNHGMLQNSSIVSSTTNNDRKILTLFPSVVDE